MAKKTQVPKSGFHQRNSFSPSKLTRELRDQWHREHPTDESVAISTTMHLDRARQYPLPEDIDPDSMVARGFNKYLEIRGSMSQLQAERLGCRTVNAATERLVFDDLLVPDSETAPVQDILDVSRGISIAKIALSSTLLYE